MGSRREQITSFQIIPIDFLYHGWILHNLIQAHLIIKTTSGFRVKK